MPYRKQLKRLGVALRIVGALFVVGLPVMMTVFPSGWSWEPRQPEYEQMIVGIYVTLGVFLFLAARDPMAHKSLILFTIWSSLVHGLIMLVQAIFDSTERMNLIGDVPVLLIIAGVLWWLLPRKVHH